VTEDRLAGPSAASPVMGDNPVAMLEKEHHLAVPVVRAERPAMVEYDGLTLPSMTHRPAFVTGG
jgi:hypothetical protein